MDLTPYIEVHTSEVLNATGTLDDVFLRRPEDPEFKEPKGIASDCDPQLLFTLQFKETIKIAAIKFICPSAQSAPKHVKLFANKLNLGFSEAEELPATQELILTKKDVDSTTDPAESATKILAAKFAKVSSLAIFVTDNQGEEEHTKITKIVLYGASQSGLPPSNVKVIKAAIEYNTLVKNSPGKTVIAYFHAAWCSHCKSVGPLVTKLSTHPELNMVFMSIDVDKLKGQLPEVDKLQGVPHFKVYKEGELIQEEAGIPNILQNMLQKFEKD